MAPQNPGQQLPLPAVSLDMSGVESQARKARTGSSNVDPNFNSATVDSFCRRVVDRTAVVLAVIAEWVYLWWRWTRFLSVSTTLWFTWPYIIAETLVIAGGSFITQLMVWNQCYRPECRLHKLGLKRSELPSVDIMIPCYNEPVEIVRQTALQALAIDYPMDKVCVCVCDDGASSAIRALIAQMRADLGDSRASLRYIARKKTPGVPHHAKAGNINNALMMEGTTGDFIVIFDCDMICETRFLDTVLPHFYKVQDGQYVVDESVAMVQTPQSFTNVPADDPLGQQYRHFYGPALRGWDAMGSTPCCGTNVVFSRKALLSINGFTYGSITEDFLTSMTLHTRGYTTKYVHEYLARGLAPETVHDFYKQRFRWAAGGLEIFVRNNALLKPGLTVMQRLLYFWAGLNTFLALPMIVLIYCPIVFLLFAERIQIATFDTYEYFIYFTPFMVLQMVVMRISYRKLPKMYLKRSLREPVFMLWCYARAVITVVVGAKLSFKVTRKGEESSAFRKDLNWVIPSLVYYFLAMMAIGKGVLDVYAASEVNDYKSLTATCVSLFWIVFIMWQMWPPIGVMLATVAREPKPINRSARPSWWSAPPFSYLHSGGSTPHRPTSRSAPSLLSSVRRSGRFAMAV